MPQPPLSLKRCCRRRLANGRAPIAQAYRFPGLFPWLLLLSCLLAARPVLAGAPSRDEAPIVAVASSLRFAWPALVAGFKGRPPRTTFGASDTLALQILNGAPFELFVSADTAAVQRVVASARADADDVRHFATGTLAVAMRVQRLGEGTIGFVAATLETLRASLNKHPSARLAIADPAHAPYGRAALQAMATVGLDSLSPKRIARGENASQALQYLTTGVVDLAIVPWSLASQLVDEEIVVAPIDVDRYAAIEHSLVVIGDASVAARDLAAWLLSPDAAAILARYGFGPPAAE